MGAKKLDFGSKGVDNTAQRGSEHHLALRMGRRGYEGDVSEAARLRHQVRDAYYRHQRRPAEYRQVFLRVCAGSGWSADRTQHGESSQLRAHSFVEYRSGRRGREVRET